jgi:hypothetical protein
MKETEIMKAIHSLFYVRSKENNEKKLPRLHDSWFLFLISKGYKEYIEQVLRFYDEEGGHGYKSRKYVSLTKSGVYLRESLFSLEKYCFYRIENNNLCVYNCFEKSIGYFCGVFLGELVGLYKISEIEKYIKFFEELREEDPLIVKLRAIKEYKDFYGLPLENIKKALYLDLAILFEEFIQGKGKEELYKKIEDMFEKEVGPKNKLVKLIS